MAEEISAAKKAEWSAKLKEFVQTRYSRELVEAANRHRSLAVDCALLEMRHPELVSLLRAEPAAFRGVAEEAAKGIDLTDAEGNPVAVRLRFRNLPELTSVRDLRARHIGQFLMTEGIVRRASEIRPEIRARTWECPACKAKIVVESAGTYAPKPFECTGLNEPCGNRRGFTEVEKTMVDTRMITIEEPFELVEGERPSQLNVALREDLVDQEGRRITEPGNRLRISGVLKEIPKDKFNSTKLDFFIEADHAEPTEVGWERVEIMPEDEEIIRQYAARPDVYDQLVASLAPSLYGLADVKEAIMLQLFGGMRRIMKDTTRFRGDIHILLIGDPASGKCVTGDTLVPLASGELVPIRSLVESKELGQKVDDGACGRGSERILSLDQSGRCTVKEANLFWRRSSPAFLSEIETASGRRVTVTPTHPFFVLRSDGRIAAKSAEALAAGEFLAVPCALPIAGREQAVTALPAAFRARNLNRMTVPRSASPEFCRFLAYLLSEGYVQKTRSGACTWFCNNDPLVLEDYEQCARIFRLPMTRRKSKAKTAQDVYISSAELASFLEALGPGICRKSRDKEIPDIVLRSENALVREFLRAFFEAEGCVNRTSIELTTASRRMAEQLQALLLRFGIFATLHPCWKEATNSPHRVKREYHRLFLSGPDAIRFAQDIGFLSERKQGAAAQMDPSSITDVIPNLAPLLRGLRAALRLDQKDMGVPRPTYLHYERGDRQPSRSSLRAIVRALEERWISAHLLKGTAAETTWEELPQVRGELHLPQAALPASQGLISQYELGKIGHATVKPRWVSVSRRLSQVRQALQQAAADIASEESRERIETLRMLCESDVRWDRIVSSRRVPAKEPWVYDLQVPGSHNFVANGLFVHNSQLLKLVPTIVPRGKYVSGKGVSTAGLTATVVKDEQFMGGWVLEAGAVVLANKGLLAIDEFEKMAPEDQVGMHESMEQQSVSIAKASIVATLPAQTSILAGGNPKRSRFDTYVSITDQITIPDTLLSRFDLKFILKDEPQSARDAQIVDHVLRGREEEDVSTVPKIPPELIRKYIAFAKSSCKPRLTKETGKLLKDFYLRMRKKAEGGGPMSITLRQFEALIRLSEASAKIQLSDVVRPSDAERAIRLMYASLQQLGFDTATGTIDVDKAEGGVGYTERTRLQRMMDLINALSQKKKDIPERELLELAQQEEIPGAEELLEKLKREGTIFSPNVGFVRKV